MNKRPSKITKVNVVIKHLKHALQKLQFYTSFRQRYHYAGHVIQSELG